MKHKVILNVGLGAGGGVGAGKVSWLIRKRPVQESLAVAETEKLLCEDLILGASATFLCP